MMNKNHHKQEMNKKKKRLRKSSLWISRLQDSGITKTSQTTWKEIAQKSALKASICSQEQLVTPERRSSIILRYKENYWRPWRSQPHHTFTTLLSLTQMSKSHAYFLIKFGDLIQQYPKLRHCKLPIRYFLQNFNTIKQVCEMDPTKWQ